MHKTFLFVCLALFTHLQSIFAEKKPLENNNFIAISQHSDEVFDISIFLPLIKQVIQNLAADLDAIPSSSYSELKEYYKLMNDFKTIFLQNNIDFNQIKYLITQAPTVDFSDLPPAEREAMPMISNMLDLLIQIDEKLQVAIEQQADYEAVLVKRIAKDISTAQEEKGDFWALFEPEEADADL